MVRVAAGQVVVDGDDMHALAGQRIQIGRQGGHQRLALAGAHFGNLALMQRHAADHLHIEMAHAEHPLAGFAHHRKGLGQQGVEAFALLHARLEFVGLGAQFRHRSFW
jgi:hypothetical protein